MTDPNLETPTELRKFTLDEFVNILKIEPQTNDAGVTTFGHFPFLSIIENADREAHLLMLAVPDIQSVYTQLFTMLQDIKNPKRLIFSTDFPASSLSGIETDYIGCLELDVETNTWSGLVVPYDNTGKKLDVIKEGYIVTELIQQSKNVFEFLDLQYKEFLLHQALKQPTSTSTTIH